MDLVSGNQRMKSHGLLLGFCLLVAAGCAGLPAFDDTSGLLTERSAAEGNRWTGRAKKKEQETAFIQQMAKARGLERAGKLVESRQVYEALIAAYPQRHEPVHRLAVVADRQRRHAEAQELYARAIDMRPTDAELFNDLGYSFFLQGKLDKAASAMTKAVALAPQETRYHNNLGLVLGQQGRREEALAAFRRAGSEADAQYNLAFICASRDENEEAKLCFRKALAADPTHTLSREALRAFERYDNDPLGLSHMPVPENGRRYVPYVEEPSSPEPASLTEVRMASHHSPAAAGESNKTGHWNWPGTQIMEPGTSGVVQASYDEPADPRTQVLQQRAHSMLIERLGP